MGTFHPRLEILPQGQLRLWPRLREVPRWFTLYGGTALALRLKHRVSVDLAAILREGMDPARALACAKAVYRHEFDPMLGLKALSYFGDLPELPRDVADFLSAAAANVGKIPEVQAAAPQITLDSCKKMSSP
jgi:hypothetical protein